MIILGIETSCDETAVCLIEATGGLIAPKFRLIGSELFSQARLHAEFGGVYPNLARREHQKNLMPLLERLLEKADIPLSAPVQIDAKKIHEILTREPELKTSILDKMSSIGKPTLDAIAVTSGPGLEPALWVGVSFAKALGEIWNVPVVATNHMEGHIVSPLLGAEEPVEFPALALLVSGGHTELVLIESWRRFRILGATRDDAVGEAFDKVARLIGLPYPGGPEISRLADMCRARGGQSEFKLPRPMIHSGNLDFSFAGLKTAVLYTVRELGTLTDTQKQNLAYEFEEATTEVLVAKTTAALEQTDAKTLILGGGVVANKRIRQAFDELSKTYSVRLLVPEKDLSTDNAVMIAMAAYIDIETGAARKPLEASGNLKVGK